MGSEWFFIAPLEEEVEKKEGKGRGHWGHEGRPGKVGGSKPGKGKVGAKPKSRAEAAEARRKKEALKSRSHTKRRALSIRRPEWTKRLARF